MDSYGQEHTFERRVSIANESGKIFRISQTYDTPQIRKELLKRNYIEQIAVPYNSIYFNVNCSLSLNQIKNIREYEQVILYKICGKRHADFVWVKRKENYHLFPDSAFVNRIYVPGYNFVNKDDLCKYVTRINQMINHEQCKMIEENSGCSSNDENNDDDDEIESENEESNNVKKNDFDSPNKMINCTRSYDIIDDLVANEFKKDFRLGCVLGLVLFLNNQSNIQNYFISYSEDDDPLQIDGDRLKALDIVFHVIVTYIRVFDGLIGPEHITVKDCDLKEADWCYICRAHYNIVRLGKKFKAPPGMAEIYISRIKYVAEEIVYYWPDRILDGFNNIWLLKPCDSGNGYGIILLDSERKILTLARSKKRKYIAQKYIEKPLLIYNHKFDIRQYYLITISQHNKFQCWSHPACTIKFATAEFTLDSLDEVIHITNVGIQRRYKRNKLNPNLPTNNAWSIENFKQYLASIGKHDVWECAIYPAIKKTLSYISELSFKNVQMKSGRFELFGCDFLVTEDYKTSLLEINRTPSLDYYTPIHADVLEEVLSDLMKVVIDYPKDEDNVSTGRFELVYEKDFS